MLLIIPLAFYCAEKLYYSATEHISDWNTLNWPQNGLLLGTAPAFGLARSGRRHGYTPKDGRVDVPDPGADGRFGYLSHQRMTHKRVTKRIESSG